MSIVLEVGSLGHDNERQSSRQGVAMRKEVREFNFCVCIHLKEGQQVAKTFSEKDIASYISRTVEIQNHSETLKQQ